jgi:hypothetical protein
MLHVLRLVLDSLKLHDAPFLCLEAQVPEDSVLWLLQEYPQKAVQEHYRQIGKVASKQLRRRRRFHPKKNLKRCARRTAAVHGSL